MTVDRNKTLLVKLWLLKYDNRHLSERIFEISNFLYWYVSLHKNTAAICFAAFASDPEAIVTFWSYYR
jgi:hypothetical protein